MARREYSDETKAAVMAANEATAYVYGLRAANDSQYFYVGCTKQSPDKRLLGHLYAVNDGSHMNRHFVNKVRKIGVRNVVCDILEETALGKQWQAEKRWIEKLLADGVVLVNRIHNDVQFKIQEPIQQRTLTREEWQRALDLAAQPPPIAKNPKKQRIYDLLHELLRAEVQASEAMHEVMAEKCPGYVRFSVD